METRELLFQSLNNCWSCEYSVLHENKNNVERCKIKNLTINKLLLLSTCEDFKKINYQEYLKKVEIEK